MSSSIALGHKSSNKSSDLLLKAHLPGNDTVIRVNGANTIKDVLDIVAAKKDLKSSEYSLKLMMADSTEIEVDDLSKKLSEYNLVGVSVFKRGNSDTKSRASMIPRTRGRKAMSILVPKESRTRMDSVSFPRTIVDEAEFSKRYSKLSGYETSTSATFRIKGSTGTLYRALSTKMFKRDAPEERPPPPSSPTSPGSSPLSAKKFSFNGKRMSGAKAQSAADLSSALGLATMFDKNYASTNDLNSPQSVESLEADTSLGSVGCIEQAVDDFPVAAVPSVMRKRHATSPISPTMTNGSMTIRKSKFHSRARTTFDDGAKFEADAQNSNCCKLTVLLPSGKELTYNMVATTIMENILKYICNQNGLDFERYTFEIPNSSLTVELDRNFHYYAVDRNVSEVSLTEGTKCYSLKWVTESGVDTMLLQLTDGNWIVMAATEEKLVEQLSDGALPFDEEYTNIILLTFRIFMRPVEFYDHLVSRFNAELPPNPTPEDVEYFEKVKGPTQMKVISVLEEWMSHYFEDFQQNHELRDDLDHLIFQIEAYPSYELKAKRLRSIMMEKIGSWRTNSDTLLEERNVEKRSKVMERPSVLEFSPEELVRQVCLYDFNLFKNIAPIEYLNQIWRKLGDQTCPQLDHFISRFDNFSYWVATEICAAKEKKMRIKVLEHFIVFAKTCQVHGNYFTMFASFAGLSLSPVSRLKGTWEGISKHARATFEEVEKMSDPSRNMKNYRELLMNTDPPMIPFLPIYMKDLTFINDGNELKVLGGLINFDKLRSMAKRVRDITDTTRVPYNYENNPVIQFMLSRPTIIKDPAKLKEMSLDCEPKQTT